MSGKPMRSPQSHHAPRDERAQSDRNTRFITRSVATTWCLLCSLSSFSLSAVPVDQKVLDAEAERISVLNRVRPTVLAIFGPSGGGGGSGVVISPDGYALSNFHVTKGSGDWMKCGMADGRSS